MSDENVREFVIVDISDEETCRHLAGARGVVVESALTRAEPVTTVTLILIGGALAVSAVMAQIERLKGGQVIDMRPGAPSVAFRSRGVVYGLVVIVSTDGTVTVDVKETDDSFLHVVDSLVSMVGELGGMTVDAVAETVQKALPAPANLEIERSPRVDGSSPGH